MRYVSARLLCNHNAMISSVPHRFHLGPFSSSYWAENVHTDIGPLMFSFSLALSLNPLMYGIVYSRHLEAIFNHLNCVPDHCEWLCLRRGHRRTFWRNSKYITGYLRHPHKVEFLQNVPAVMISKVSFHLYSVYDCLCHCVFY